MKKINLAKKLFSVYLFLFLFTMTNKEFQLFGLDLRYPLIMLALLLLVIRFTLKKEKEKFTFDSSGKILIAFYVYVLLSALFWRFNSIEPYDIKLVVNEFILIINVLLSYLVFNSYKKYIDRKKLTKYLVISVAVLCLSIVLVHFGVSYTAIGGNADAPYIYGQEGIASTHITLYGGYSRIAGFASDPNYATLLLLIGVAFALRGISNKKIKFLAVLLFIATMGFTFSKSILIAVIIGLMIIGVKKIFNVSKKAGRIINTVAIVTVLSIAIASPFLGNLKSYLPDTLTTRLSMWDSASELFAENPLTGNGLVSFRSYFELSHPNWHVQCHSTYWQLLCELGLIGFVMYVYNLIKSINSIDNNYNYIIFFSYMVWAMTYESIALQFSVFILYLMNIERKEAHEKSALLN